VTTTVACVWVQGHVPFTPDYVTRLASMVARHLTRPYRFVCLTDRPWLFRPPIQTIAIAPPGKLKGWWRKLELFNPHHARKLTGRILYLDLDTLVVKPLEPILDWPSPFALLPDAGTWKGRDGLRVVKRYNSSVMVWDAGYPRTLYQSWSPAVAAELWGDQDWIGLRWPMAATLPAAWFPRLSDVSTGPPFGEAKVILAKKPKNIEASRLYSWFEAAWV
jgi:hypothetical protein